MGGAVRACLCLARADRSQRCRLSALATASVCAWPSRVGTVVTRYLAGPDHDRCGIADCPSTRMGVRADQRPGLSPLPALSGDEAPHVNRWRRRRWLRTKVRICVLEVEVYGRIVSESLRAEIEHEDTQSSGCLAAEARVALATYHPLADPVKPHRDPDRPIRPTRPSPTRSVIG